MTYDKHLPYGPVTRSRPLVTHEFSLPHANLTFSFHAQRSRMACEFFNFCSFAKEKRKEKKKKLETIAMELFGGDRYDRWRIAI